MTATPEPLPDMIGRHPSMLAVYELVRRAAPSDLPVLIVGETGTGKELVARAFHELSPAGTGPFVDLNCAAIPESLAEGELFGWERGAFTGAVGQRRGLLEAASGGTLFLDEVCSLPVSVQAKLLRALEYHDFRRVGGSHRISARFRLLAASSEDVGPLVASGRLRADFAFRMAGLTVTLPPLRRRGNDVRLLAERFLDALSAAEEPKALGPDALALLQRHGWPGNVRELRALIGRLAVLTDQPTITGIDVMMHLPALLDDVDEEQRLQMVLAAHRWRMSEAARALKISRGHLYRLLSKHGLHRDGSRDAKCLVETEEPSPGDTPPIAMIR